jgi:hypothetical protein
MTTKAEIVQQELIKRQALEYSVNGFRVFSHHYLGITPYKVQLEWVELFLENDELLELCPGGHGKSQTAYNVATWLIVLNRFMPICGAAVGELNIAFLSNAAELGEKWLFQIKAYLTSDKIVKDFGVFRNPAKWSNNGFLVLSPNNPEAKVDHPTVTAAGIGGQVFGPRVHVLIWDDIADKENSGTDPARKKLWEAFHEGPFCWRRPGGKRWGIGTRMHSRDIYSKKIAQCTKLVVDTPLTKVYKGRNLVVRVDKAIDWDTSEVLAPENKQYTKKFFQNELDGMLSASFNRRYMNMAIDEVDAAFHAEWFEELYDTKISYGQVPKGHKVYIGIDPAVGVGKGRSHVGLAAIAYDPKNPSERVLVDYHSSQLTPEKQADMAIRWYLDYKCSLIRIERNACQRYLKDYILERAKKYGASPRIDMPFTGAQKWDVDYGVSVVAGRFENGTYKLPYSDAAKDKTHRLRDLLLESEATKPPDILMAMWFVEQYLQTMAKRRSNRIKLDTPDYLRPIMKRVV